MSGVASRHPDVRREKRGQVRAWTSARANRRRRGNGAQASVASATASCRRVALRHRRPPAQIAGASSGAWAVRIRAPIIQQSEVIMRVFSVALTLLLVHTATNAGAQPRNDLPQPYETTRTWGELPAGTKAWAAVTAIEPEPDGSIYVVHRCFENSCEGRREAPILKYDAGGKLLATFGQGMFNFPHGGTVDRDGNLW